MKLVFPTAEVSPSDRRGVTEAHDVKDPAGRVIARQSNALGDGSAYDVVGLPESFESNFADHIDAQAQPLANHREVRIQLYRWQQRNMDPMLVAVLSYHFRGANPARCCLELGRTILLNTSADRILNEFRIAPHAFGPFTEIRFLPLVGGRELLIFGASYAPAATSAVISIILDVVNDHWKPVLAVDTVMQYFFGEQVQNDVHTLTLDEVRTVAAGGKRFYYVRQTWMRRGRTLSKPSTERLSFPAGFGFPLGW